jgi:predicted ATPase/transcriptional regulator with XRE-family HTH domain
MSTDPATPPFAVLLKERRLRAGLTQEALAERAGLSARNIQNLERGENRPLADTIARLAAALDLSLDDRARFAAAGTPPPRHRQTSAAASHAPAALAPSPHERAANLPQPLTSFVGHEREIALILGLVDDGARLITLTGVGGTGKTRLAVQVARTIEARFADGVAFVDLTATRDAALAPAVLAQALGLQEAAGRPLADHLADVLCARRLLLVLDNCEHVLGVAPLIADLLAAAPRLTVLSTSRVSLRLYGEHEVRVPPLAAPDPASAIRDEGRDDPHDYPAVQLFLQRARLVRPDLAVTPETLAAIGQICGRLDGLPLAIELAAARVKLYSPQQVLERLGERLTLLVGGARNLPERQQTLRATLDWSHALLTSAEQRLFARLAVFRGSWDLASAVAVCAPGLPGDTLTGLESLVDQNLVESDGDGADEPRFRLLETVHEYARARLAEGGEAAEMRRRHAHHYLALAEEAEGRLIGPDQVAWLRRLDRELPNLRAALRTLLDEGETAAALQLAAALERFWARRGYPSEGRAWLDEALALDAGAGAERAKALAVSGSLAVAAGDFARAEGLLDEALALYRALEDERGVARALFGQGELAFVAGDPAHAVACREEALALSRRVGDRWGVAMALYNLGGTGAILQGNMAGAELLLRESKELFEAQGDRWGVAAALVQLAVVAALPLLVSGAAGDDAAVEAVRRAREALPLCAEVDLTLTVLSLGASMVIWSAAGQPRRAVRLKGAFEAVCERSGLAMPAPPSQRPMIESFFARLRAQLGETAFAAALAEGGALSFDEAIQEALARN